MSAQVADAHVEQVLVGEAMPGETVAHAAGPLRKVAHFPANSSVLAASLTLMTNSIQLRIVISRTPKTGSLEDQRTQNDGTRAL